MYNRIVFCCDFCGEEFHTIDCCESHEAVNHYCISPDEYKTWKILFHNAAKAGKQCGSALNRETRKNFDEAIRELVDFENLHGLSDMKAPVNWYY